MSRGSSSCVPDVVTRTSPRNALPPPLYCISGSRAWGVQGTLNHRTLRPASVGGVVPGYKGPYAMQALPALGHTQRNCGYAPRCVAYGGSHLSGGCSTPREQPQCCGCVGNHTANYLGCAKCKEAKAAIAKQAPQRDPRNAATGHPATPKAQQAGPSAEQLALGEGWSHVARGGACCQGYCHHSAP